MEKFIIPDKHFCKFYWDNGYAILSKLINNKYLERFYKSYRTIKNSELKYFAMTTQKLQNIELTKNGFVKHPIADAAICDYINSDLKEFAKASRSLLSSNEIVNCLRAIHNNENYYHAVMTMFFDANAGTPAHCDNYYLDSLPGGNLTAAWIALEDIDENAGRFFVLKQSNKNEFDLSQEQIDNADEYETYMKEFVSNNKVNLIIPALKKGDVLFWNSQTVHGSTKTKDFCFSRKSFTCHYIPKSYKFVRNKYYPIVRSTDGLEVKNINFRFSSNIDKNEILNLNQKGRSLNNFENF